MATELPVNVDAGDDHVAVRKASHVKRMLDIRGLASVDAIGRYMYVHVQCSTVSPAQPSTCLVYIT